MEGPKSTKSKERIIPVMRNNDKSDRETTDDDIFNDSDTPASRVFSEDDIPSSSAQLSAPHQPSNTNTENTKLSSNDELIQKMEQIHNSKSTSGKFEQIVDSTTDKNTANDDVEVKDEPMDIDNIDTPTQRDASAANTTVEKRDSASQTFDGPDSANENEGHKDSTNKKAEVESSSNGASNNCTSESIHKVSTYEVSKNKVSTNQIKLSDYHISDKKTANPSASLNSSTNQSASPSKATNQSASQNASTNQNSSQKASTNQISSQNASTTPSASLIKATNQIASLKKATNQSSSLDASTNPAATSLDVPINQKIPEVEADKEVSIIESARKKICTGQNFPQKDSGITPLAQKVASSESSTSETLRLDQQTDRPAAVVDNNNSAQIIHHNLRVENERTPVASAGSVVRSSESSIQPPTKPNNIDERQVDSSRVEATKRKLWTSSEDRNFTRASTSTPVISRTDVKNIKKKPVTKAKRSGLVFPVARILRKMKKGRYARHIGTGAAIYMAAVLEYLTAEVLELSGGFTKKWKKYRIIPRAILLTLRMDYELEELCRGIIIPQGGTRPFIHNALLPKKDQIREREPSPEYD